MYTSQQLKQFRLQNKLELSGFFRKCAEQVVMRRTMLVVAYCSILRHGRTDRRQCSLQLGEDDWGGACGPLLNTPVLMTALLVLFC